MRGGQGRGYSPPRAPAIVTVSSPAAMRFLALLLAAQMVASPDTVPPYLTFPEPGLDDPAAYQGYATRVFRDAKGNAFQVYVNGRIGRVVNLWADAADESVGFTVRDSAGAPAALDWASSGALAGASPRGSGGERERSVSYGLGAGPGPGRDVGRARRAGELRRPQSPVGRRGGRRP